MGKETGEGTNRGTFLKKAVAASVFALPLVGAVQVPHAVAQDGCGHTGAQFRARLRNAKLKAVADFKIHVKSDPAGCKLYYNLDFRNAERIVTPPKLFDVLVNEDENGNPIEPPAQVPVYLPSAGFQVDGADVSEGSLAAFITAGRGVLGPVRPEVVDALKEGGGTVRVETEKHGLIEGTVVELP